jgi:hypothetical protein
MSAPKPSPSQKFRKLLLPPLRLKNGLMNASDEELEHGAELCERWALRCAGVLILGLLVELGLAYCDPPHESYWGRWGTFWATCLVVTGVWGEVAFGRMGSRRQGELANRSKERAAEALERAEKIKAAAAWRTLSPEERAKLKVALDARSESSIVINHVANDPESQNLVAQFRAIFEARGWIVSVLSGSSPREIVFGFRAPNPTDPLDEYPASAIQAVLTAAGIAFVADKMPEWLFAGQTGEALGASQGRLTWSILAAATWRLSPCRPWPFRHWPRMPRRRMAGPEFRRASLGSHL